MKTVRLTMAQALVRFLENQYIDVDGVQTRFVRGVFIIPGHGNVVGLGQALSQEGKHLEVYQGKNEQGMAQAAVAFAKQMKRSRSSRHPAARPAPPTWSPPAAPPPPTTSPCWCCPAMCTPAASPTPCCSRWSRPTTSPSPPTTLSRPCAATGTASSGPSS